MPDSPKNYLVCATHRSGSNLVCQALWHTDLCGRPQEFFSPTRAEHIAKEHQLSANPATDYPAYLSELISSRRTDNGVFGGKMMWAHLKHFRASTLGDQAETTTTAELIRQHFGDDVRCIWARREDKLRQSISMWKAKQSNIYNSIQTSANERPEPTKQPEFDFDEIKKILTRFEKEEASWKNFFEENHFPHRAVTYETFVTRYQEEARELVDFLGIGIPPEFSVAPTTYTKLADS
ncbi:MAG: LPS sulfotransferase NodH, partial [Pseudoalteromonas tetraodonis]